MLGDLGEEDTMTGERAMRGSAQWAFDPALMEWCDSDLPRRAGHRGDMLAPLMAEQDKDARPARDPLSGAGLTLRAWTPADRHTYRALLDDPQLWAFLPEPYPEPFDEDTARSLIIAANTLPDNLVRAVFQGDQPIGQLRLEWRAGEARGEAELSYWLGRAHWGGGIGSAMVLGAVARAFGNDPSLLRLIAKVHPENPASARLLQKAGFSALAAPPDGHGFSDWRWFALRRQNRLHS